MNLLIMLPRYLRTHLKLISLFSVVVVTLCFHEAYITISKSPDFEKRSAKFPLFGMDEGHRPGFENGPIAFVLNFDQNNITA